LILQYADNLLSGALTPVSLTVLGKICYLQDTTLTPKLL